jgi:hypothetical protein
VLCGVGFGLPSYRATICMALPTFMSLDLIITQRKTINKPLLFVNEDGSVTEIEPLKSKKLTIFHSVLIVLAGLVVSIFLSGIRYIENMDFLSDVLAGWVLGIWLGGTFAIILREPFDIHIRNLTNCEVENSLLTSFLISTTLVALMVIISVVQYSTIE